MKGKVLDTRTALDFVLDKEFFHNYGEKHSQLRILHPHYSEGKVQTFIGT